MFEMTLEVDEAEVKRRLGTLSDKSGKVIMRAVNRSYTTGKNAISREAAKDYRVKQKDINGAKTLRIVKATEKEPTATLDYTGTHRNLALWDSGKAVSPIGKRIHWSNSRPIGRAKDGRMQFRGGTPNVRTYRAAVERAHGKIGLQGDNKPFIQTVRKGQGKREFTGLFRRKSKERDATLVGVAAPSVPQILKNDRVMANFTRSAGPMLQKRLEHEIDNVLKGITN
jgi:hypothetical protein